MDFPVLGMGKMISLFFTFVLFSHFKPGKVIGKTCPIKPNNFIYDFFSSLQGPSHKVKSSRGLREPNDDSNETSDNTPTKGNIKADTLPERNFGGEIPYG